MYLSFRPQRLHPFFKKDPWNNESPPQIRTRLDFFFLFGLLPKAQTLWLSCCLCQFCQFWCCQPISVSATVTNPRHLDKKLRFELQAAASPRGVTNASFHFNAHVKGLWNGKIVQSRDILSCDANTSLAACETHSSSLCCHIPPTFFSLNFISPFILALTLALSDSEYLSFLSCCYSIYCGKIQGGWNWSSLLSIVILPIPSHNKSREIHSLFKRIVVIFQSIYCVVPVVLLLLKRERNIKSKIIQMNITSRLIVHVLEGTADTWVT